MTLFRRDAIGVTWPARSYRVTAEDAPGGRASLGLALLYSFAGATELADPRVFDRPFKLWEHIVGGFVELRAGAAPVAPGDLITTVARVADVLDRHAAAELVVDTASQNQEADLVCEARFTFHMPTGAPPPAARKVRATTPPSSHERETQMGRFDFVEIRATPSSGRGAPEIDPFRTALEVVVNQAGSDHTQLRTIGARIMAPLPRGEEIVVHGRRDPRRAEVIQFEAIARGGIKILESGLAEIS